MSARSKLDGRCVKTIVFSSPKRPASRTAPWNESACRIPTAKNAAPRTSGEVPYVSVNQYAMNACVTKPPPKESSAKRPERRRTIPRERSSGARALRATGSTASESPSVSTAPTTATTT